MGKVADTRRDKIMLFCSEDPWVLPVNLQALKIQLIYLKNLSSRCQGYSGVSVKMIGRVGKA